MYLVSSYEQKMFYGWEKQMTFIALLTFIYVFIGSSQAKFDCVDISWADPTFVIVILLQVVAEFPRTSVGMQAWSPVACLCVCRTRDDAPEETFTPSWCCNIVSGTAKSFASSALLMRFVEFSWKHLGWIIFGGCAALVWGILHCANESSWVPALEGDISRVDICFQQWEIITPQSQDHSYTFELTKCPHGQIHTVHIFLIHPSSLLSIYPSLLWLQKCQGGLRTRSYQLLGRHWKNHMTFFSLYVDILPILLVR